MTPAAGSVLARKKIPESYPLPMQDVPSSETTLRHYTRIWAKERALLNRAVPSKKNMAFFTATVLHDIGGQSLNALFDNPSLIEDVLMQIERRYGTSKAKFAYTLLNTICRSMLSSLLLPANLCSGLYRPVRNPPRYYLLSEPQRILIYKLSTENPRLAPIGFCLATGMASDEIPLLRFQDFNPSAGSISVHAGPSGKRFSRLIPLSRQALTILEPVLQRHHTENDCIFVNRKGKPLTSITLTDRLRGVKLLSGIDTLSFHNILLDFIIRSLRCGADPIQLKDYLGIRYTGSLLDCWGRISPLQNERSHYHD